MRGWPRSISQPIEQRRRHATDIEAGRDEAEHLAEGAGRRDGAHHHVARRLDDAVQQAADRHDGDENGARQVDPAHQHGHGRGKGEAHRGDPFVVRRAVGDDAAQQHAEGAEQQEARQRHVGDRGRRAPELAQRHDGVGVDAAIGHADADEEDQVADHRAGQQQLEADGSRRLGRAAARHMPRRARQDGARHDQQQRGGDRQHRRQHESALPAPDRRRGEDDGGRHRGAEEAREIVDREGLADALGADRGAEDGVVGRVIDGVGETEEGVGDDEQPVAGQQRGDQQRHGAQQQAAGQHGARADAVDHEAGRRLQERRDDVVGGERDADLDVADAEGLAHRAEDRRQKHQVEVADEVRRGDQGDHLGVLAYALVHGAIGRDGRVTHRRHACSTCRCRRSRPRACRPPSSRAAACGRRRRRPACRWR